MLLPHDQAMRFIEAYKAALLEVLAMEHIEQTGSVIENLAKARDLVAKAPDLLDGAIKRTTNQGIQIEPDVLLAIRSLRVSHWVFLRQNRISAIFIDQAVQNSYSVKALTTPLDQVVSPVPCVFKAGVFTFLGYHVCDGIIQDFVGLGPGYRSQFNAAYAQIRTAGRHHGKADEVGKPIA